jgi:hypothetical protein
MESAIWPSARKHNTPVYPALRHNRRSRRNVCRRGGYAAGCLRRRCGCMRCSGARGRVQPSSDTDGYDHAHQPPRPSARRPPSRSHRRPTEIDGLEEIGLPATSTLTRHELSLLHLHAAPTPNMLARHAAPSGSYALASAQVRARRASVTLGSCLTRRGGSPWPSSPRSRT